jgi:hypothetical protein
LSVEKRRQRKVRYAAQTSQLVLLSKRPGSNFESEAAGLVIDWSEHGCKVVVNGLASLEHASGLYVMSLDTKKIRSALVKWYRCLDIEGIVVLGLEYLE